MRGPVRVAGLILAAGAGRRFGGLKLLAPIAGEPMVRRVVRRALESSLDPVLVVLGSDADEIRQSLTGLDCQFVLNGGWPAGQGSSISAGVLAAARQPDIVAVVVLLADQPDVDPALIDREIEAHEAGAGPMVAPSWAGVIGPPVLFDRSMFDALRLLEGDRGARELIERERSRVTFVAVGGPVPQDIDTRADLERYRTVATPEGPGKP